MAHWADQVLVSTSNVLMVLVRKSCRLCSESSHTRFSLQELLAPKCTSNHDQLAHVLRSRQLNPLLACFFMSPTLQYQVPHVPKMSFAAVLHGISLIAPSGAHRSMPDINPFNSRQAWPSDVSQGYNGSQRLRY